MTTYDDKKTAEFIRKARSIHGYRKFDYSKTRLNRFTDRVTIICKKKGHTEFTIVAQNHATVGRPGGCPDCWKTQNRGGAKGRFFEGKKYRTIKDLAKAHGMEGNELTAFLKRIPNFREASEAEIRAALDKKYAPRDLLIVWQEVEYSSFKSFYAAVKDKTAASYNSLRRWIVHEGIDIEQALNMQPSVPDGNGLIYAASLIGTTKKYIGQTRMSLDRRWNSHIASALKKNSSTTFHKAIRKYGPDAFKISVIQDNIKSSALSNAETRYIEQYNSVENGFNVLKKGQDAAPRGKETFCGTCNHRTRRAAAKCLATSQNISYDAADKRIESGNYFSGIPTPTKSFCGKCTHSSLTEAGRCLAHRESISLSAAIHRVKRGRFNPPKTTAIKTHCGKCWHKSQTEAGNCLALRENLTLSGAIQRIAKAKKKRANKKK